VITRTGATHGNVRTLHEWAALRQLSWRSLYTSRNSADRDSVASIVFSFIDNQLFKIVIDYDRGRTKELTKDDIITSLSAIYGPRSTARAPAPQRSRSIVSIRLQCSTGGARRTAREFCCALLNSGGCE